MTYLDGDEMFGAPIPPTAVARMTTALSIEQTIAFAAYWLAKLARPRANRRAVDSEFVQQYLAEPHRTRIINILRDPSRALIVPQALMTLIKYALLHATSRGVPRDDESDSPVALALLGITAYLGPTDEIPEEELVLADIPGELGRELIANQIFNATRDPKGIWAMFERCFRELPRELAGNPRMVDLPAEYESATGVPLDDLVTVSGALWASAANGRSTLTMSYFQTLNWDERRLTHALDLISTTPENMREMLAEEVEQFGISWSTRTFERYPVVRWPTGHLTVISPTMVIKRASGLWPMFDILRELETHGDMRKASKVQGAVALAHEIWALEGFREIVGGRPDRFYSEEQLRKAFPGSKVADAALDYGDSWVVVEVTTKGIQAATAAGSSDYAVTTDLDDCIRKARQLDATIDNLRHRQDKLTGVKVGQPPHFHPVLVIADRFASGPILTTLLWERLTNLGVLQGPDVAPLEVMEMEDLNVTEGLLEQGSLSLADLLAAKQESSLRTMPMREYVLVARRDAPPAPRRVIRRWERWIGTVISALRGSDPPRPADA